MSDYTKTTDFATKDSLPSGNPNKAVLGAEIDTEFNNIATAVATKLDEDLTGLTGTVPIANGGTGATSAATARTNLGLGSSAVIDYSTTTVTADNDFSSGTIYLTKIGNVVTLHFDLLQHPTGVSASTSVGLIPAAYRPSTSWAWAVTAVRAVGVDHSTVYQNGIFTISHFDWSGVGLTYTNITSGCISYIVP